MTVTLRSSGERVHVFEAEGERWATFVPADPRRGFRGLESLVEHDLAPRMGFRVHADHDHEVVTYVEQGGVIQGDPGGRTYRLRAGEFRRRTLLRGMVDRVLNTSRAERAHVYQSGIALPQGGLKPGGEQKRFPFAERRGLLRLIASPDGSRESLRIAPDVRMYSSLLDRGTHLIHELGAGRHGWLHVVGGRVELGEHGLGAGDAVGLVDEVAVSFTAQEPSEVLLFDLP